MSINVSQSFHRTSANAVDDTLTLTKAEMLAVNDNLMPGKYLSVCQDDGKLYLYDKSATPNAETGKFKRYGGHDIEDDQGTAVTPRDVIQFGEGFDVSDDSTNGKTVIEPDVMASADMDDVVTPLPSVASRYHEYSETEQVVGKWIDGSTIYERVIAVTTPTVVTEGTSVYKNYALGVSIDKSIRCDVIFETTDGNAVITNDLYGNRNNVTISGTTVSSNNLGYIRAFLRTSRHINANNLSIGVNASAFSNLSGYAILQYTKTT